MTLLEAARELGVETRKAHQVSEYRDSLCLAYEVLAKLPPTCGYVCWGAGLGWRSCRYFDLSFGENADDLTTEGTFEECVTALARRYLESRK